MKTEYQVCSFQQAKRLKELGVTKVHPDNEDESGFYYVNDGSLQFFSREEGFPSTLYMAAFTVSELGVMLPHKIKAIYPRKDKENVFEIALYNDSHGFTIQYENKGLHDAYAAYCRTNGSLEAYTRAAMLIHLLESGHISSEQVNQNILNS